MFRLAPGRPVFRPGTGSVSPTGDYPFGSGMDLTSLGPALLLLASAVNQLPIVSVLVPTEPVYVYLGTRLASGEGWVSILAYMIGAWVGNQGSFWLGRTAGPRLLPRMGADGAGFPGCGGASSGTARASWWPRC